MNVREKSFTRERFSRWLDGDESLCASQMDLFGTPTPAPRTLLGKTWVTEAYSISCFRSDSQWSFLNGVCRRIHTEGAAFLNNPADADAAQWRLRLKAIGRDVHKAHAFVRFKKVDGEHFAAWHRPEHETLDLFKGLFCRRFPTMEWTILTPDESIHFKAGKVEFGDGFQGQPPTVDDEWEAFWSTYYRSIFNPARLMVKAMKKEMPVKHWQTLPESRLIGELIRESRGRVHEMGRVAHASAQPFVPEHPQSLEQLHSELESCQGCRLARLCKPTAGHGNAHASVVFVGEQPGDEEEKRGLPFVGPAGEVLRGAVKEAGGNWESLYVTNAVKHFKHEYEGGFRLHKRPERDEVAACRPWFAAEMKLVQPKVVVCLGSTAALSVTGRLWPVEKYRGTWLPSPHPYRVLLTYHPAAILRTAEEKTREYREGLVRDLRLALAG